MGREEGAMAMKRWASYGRHPIRAVCSAAVALGFCGLAALVVVGALTGEGRPFNHPRGELEPVCEVEYCPGPPLIYQGGKIQSSPALYVAFWGSNWNSKGAMLRAQIIKMYKDFSGSSYQGILTQYFEKAGNRIAKTLKVTSFTDTKVTAPASVTKETLETEVNAAIKEGKWPEEPNGQYIVIPAPGSGYAETFEADHGCGYHSEVKGKELSWALVAFAGDEPFLKSKFCNGKGNVNAETMATASHEYAESATDPFFNRVEGWTTADHKYEITDICYSDIFELPDGSWVEAQWDNFKNECTTSDEAPVFLYVITEPAEATAKTATLKGLINPENMETTYHFEYGTTPALGMKTAEVGAGSGWETKAVKQLVEGLKEKTDYDYVLVAKNSKGTAKGRQMKVETL
jgi:hypothetical protein